MSSIKGVNLDGLLRYYRVEPRRSGAQALSPGEFVILRGGFLGLVQNPSGAITKQLGYMAVRIENDKPPILVHADNKKNIGIAAHRIKEFDVIYCIPRTEWPSLYACATVDEARAHLNKFSQNPDQQTLIGSKLSYATVARYYKGTVPSEGLFNHKVYRSVATLDCIEFKTPDEAFNAIRQRAGQYNFKPKVVPEPEPEPVPVMPDLPKGGGIERGRQDGFVRTVTTYHIEGEMQFGDNVVTVKANGGDVQVTANGGFMSADDLAMMIAELEKVREAIDGG